MCDSVLNDAGRRISLSGRRVWMVAIGGALLFGWAAAATGQRDGRPQAAEMTVSRDIEYVPGGHERQKLDLYLPKKAGLADSVAPRRPLIVWIHGRAWRAGSKDRCPARRFVREGYAVASVNYRLSQHAIFPAQIQDCKAGIRHLRAHAEEYGLDGARFGVWGSSAGGHLVALLGTAGGVEEFDVGPNTGVSSRVQAVCDFFGPTDFAKMSRFWSTMDHDAPDSPESKLIGGPVQEHKDNVQRANPITYVTKDARTPTSSSSSPSSSNSTWTTDGNRTAESTETRSLRRIR